MPRKYTNKAFSTHCGNETDDVCCEVLNNQGQVVEAGLILLEGAEDFVDSVTDIYKELNKCSDLSETI